MVMLMRILPGRGRLPITPTVVTSIVGLIVLALGSVLAIGYSTTKRNTLNLVGDSAAESGRFVVDELRDHLDPVVEQVNWAADLLAAGAVDLADDREIGHLLLGALAATPHVTGLIYFSVERRSVRAYRDGPEGCRAACSVRSLKSASLDGVVSTRQPSGPSR